MTWGAPPPIELEPGDSPRHPLAPWFGTARRDRAAHRRPEPRPASPPSRAIITMVHNEPIFLPIWLRYYSRFFGPEQLYVLDNDTTDGSTSGEGFVRIPVNHPCVDHVWMVKVVQELQHELLGRYDIVVVTDVDELIAPVPALGTLGDYLDRFQEAWVNCLGYELIHRPDRESPLDLQRPILGQRHWWFANDVYNKAAVATTPLDWRPGFHGRSDHQFQMDPDLRLVHLHRMDYAICLARHRTREQRPWAQRDAREGWASHNRIIDETEFSRWFSGEGYAGTEVVVEAIPEQWRAAF